jgi:SAM-dependent methyltransferase
MPTNIGKEIDIQRRYYAETATRYDDLHVHESDEHFLSMCVMLSVVDFFGIRSILDIGSGTGRAISQIKNSRPDIIVKGIEPVKELREVAFNRGISPDMLLDGDALALQFGDGEFDLVCEFGVLHHIRNPGLAVKEMLRVSKKAIFISDSNNFGQGSLLVRSLKQMINMVGMWRLANLIKTGGRGYVISEGDGLAYSYSVFNNYRQINRQCKSVHIFNTTPAGVNPYRTASHVALLGIKL